MQFSPIIERWAMGTFSFEVDLYILAKWSQEQGYISIPSIEFH